MTNVPPVYIPTQPSRSTSTTIGAYNGSCRAVRMFQTLTSKLTFASKAGPGSAFALTLLASDRKAIFSIDVPVGRFAS